MSFGISKDFSTWRADIDVCAYPEDLTSEELRETLSVLEHNYYREWLDLKRYLDGNEVHKNDEVFWNKEDGTSRPCRVLDVDKKKGTARLCPNNYREPYWECEVPLKDIVIRTIEELIRYWW